MCVWVGSMRIGAQVALGQEAGGTRGQRGQITLVHRTIWEHALLRAVGIDILDRAVSKGDFLGAPRVVLLRLRVAKVEHLQAVGVGGVRGVRAGVIIHDVLVRVALFFVAVGEGHLHEAIAEDAFAGAVGK